MNRPAVKRLLRNLGSAYLQSMIVWGMIVLSTSSLDVPLKGLMSRYRIILVTAEIRLSLFLASMESTVVGPLGNAAYRKE